METKISDRARKYATVATAALAFAVLRPDVEAARPTRASHQTSAVHVQNATNGRTLRTNALGTGSGKHTMRPMGQGDPVTVTNGTITGPPGSGTTKKNGNPSNGSTYTYQFPWQNVPNHGPAKVYPIRTGPGYKGKHGPAFPGHDHFGHNGREGNHWNGNERNRNDRGFYGGDNYRNRGYYGGYEGYGGYYGDNFESYGEGYPDMYWYNNGYGRGFPVYFQEGIPLMWANGCWNRYCGLEYNAVLDANVYTYPVYTPAGEQYAVPVPAGAPQVQQQQVYAPESDSSPGSIRIPQNQQQVYAPESDLSSGILQKIDTLEATQTNQGKKIDALASIESDDVKGLSEGLKKVSIGVNSTEKPTVVQTAVQPTNHPTQHEHEGFLAPFLSRNGANIRDSLITLAAAAGAASLGWLAWSKSSFTVAGKQRKLKKLEADKAKHERHTDLDAKILQARRDAEAAETKRKAGPETPVKSPA